MGKAKRLTAAALAVLALATTAAWSVASAGEGVQLACTGGTGSSGGCYG
jgi:hypothetical protein